VSDEPEYTMKREPVHGQPSPKKHITTMEQAVKAERARLVKLIIKPLVDWIDKFDCECDSYVGHVCGLCEMRVTIEAARKEVAK